MNFVDTHCHLNLLHQQQNLDEIIDNAINSGINRIMVPGIDLASSLNAIKIAEKHEIVYAAVGYHPNDASKWDDNSYSTLLKLSQHPKVKAIGEIGLDFYRDYVPIPQQMKVFCEQLSLSEATNLPVIVHSRNSIQEIIRIIIEWNSFQKINNQHPGVLHAFEGNLAHAREITNFNFFIGIGGPVTYKNANDKHELVKKLPIKSILLETDSPFLTPHPLRGKPNEPANIKLIAERIATLTEKPLKWISQETSQNANKIFAWE